MLTFHNGFITIPILEDVNKLVVSGYNSQSVLSGCTFGCIKKLLKFNGLSPIALKQYFADENKNIRPQLLIFDFFPVL